MYRFAKTSSAEMKGEASSAKLLDKTIWNPRPVIGLLPQAIAESGGPFLHFFWAYNTVLHGRKLFLLCAV
jgi:hypothetical protein